jgi:hypothetical protein
VSASTEVEPWSSERESWAELTPLVRRVARNDATACARIRRVGPLITLFATLASKALVGRTIPAVGQVADYDVTLSTAALLSWVDGANAELPTRDDGRWLSGLPPVDGWQRIDSVPETVIREVVGQGALAHTDAANLGLGAKAAQNLLDTAVLTVDGGATRTELTNRSLSALVAMGFLPADSHIVVAVAGRWTRMAAAYGSVFSENRGGGLALL